MLFVVIYKVNWLEIMKTNEDGACERGQQTKCGCQLPRLTAQFQKWQFGAFS